MSSSTNPKTNPTSTSSTTTTIVTNNNNNVDNNVNVVLPMTLLQIPREVQIHLLTFLRAYDLSAVQQTCKFYNDPDLIDHVVTYYSIEVYTPELTKGIIERKNKDTNTNNNDKKYTLEHLRNMELTVVARVLSLPEPKAGFYVSKAWIRKTLLWLEKVNEPPPAKKLSKKQQRQRARRLSDVTAPWPNVNSDIVCPHQQLQRCSAKSARARRRLMDKQAWKVLKKLYPDSTQLESVSGECLLCMMEKETAKKNQQDIIEKEKLERKKPLSNPYVRRFYTRNNRGVPVHCIKSNIKPNECPLTSGTYYILPRSWCHQWRKYIKTGEGCLPTPPDSSALLCDAHKYALLPPHLESYLRGETTQLLSTTKYTDDDGTGGGGVATVAAAASGIITSPGNNNSKKSRRGHRSSSLPVGVTPELDPATVNAAMAAGISHSELLAQQMAMLRMENQFVAAASTSSSPPSVATLRSTRSGPSEAPVASPGTTAARRSVSSTSVSQNDILDRENHIVVELLTQEEWSALQEKTGCWSKQQHVSSFALSVTISEAGKVQVGKTCQDNDDTNNNNDHEEDDEKKLPFDYSRINDDSNNICNKVDRNDYVTTTTTTTTSSKEAATTTTTTKIFFSTIPCRECDPSGSRYTACASVKYRRNKQQRGNSSSSSSSSIVPKLEY